MTADEVRAMLRTECDKAGSQAAWAKAHKLSTSYVSEVLGGTREPSEAICKALGLESYVIYRRVKR